MPTLIHERVRLAQRAENPTVICPVPSGWVVLGDNQTIRGYTLLLSDPVVPDLNCLSLARRGAFLRDMSIVGDALLEVTGAYLVNYAVLGNTDNELHAHIHPRQEDEPDDKRRSGTWAYFPPYPQVPFDLGRDRPLIASIAGAIERFYRKLGIDRGAAWY
jgi:diadenosine tetraphosphate (Ap4A) HIT family hydrolase